MSNYWAGGKIWCFMTNKKSVYSSFVFGCYTIVNWVMEDSSVHVYFPRFTMQTTDIGFPMSNKEQRKPVYFPFLCLLSTHHPVIS